MNTDFHRWNFSPLICGYLCGSVAELHSCGFLDFRGSRTEENLRRIRWSQFVTTSSFFGVFQFLFLALVIGHCLGQRLLAGLAFQDATQTADGNGAFGFRCFVSCFLHDFFDSSILRQGIGQADVVANFDASGKVGRASLRGGCMRTIGYRNSRDTFSRLWRIP
jgi:hypothetical protein